MKEAEYIIIETTGTNGETATTLEESIRNGLQGVVRFSDMIHSHGILLLAHRSRTSMASIAYAAAVSHTLLRCKILRKWILN